VIRVLIHGYKPDGTAPEHVYLGDAVKLRLDLQGAQ
jgi:chorismate mutase